MIQIENNYFLLALILIPLFIIVYWVMNRWKKNALNAYGDLTVIEQLYPAVSKTKRIWKFILFNSAFLLLIIGIVNPQVGTKLEEVKHKGADLMICMDVSNSMKAEDLIPNRLEKAKLAVAKLIDKLNGDRIGIIVFAGEAYVQLPITTDYAAAKLFLESVNTDMVSSQGTAIGKAIGMAVESFGKDEGKNKAIFIMTDGENHEDDAIASAKAAVEKGITVHTIGMGSPNGSPIPLYRGNTNIGFRKDKDGNTVITKLNELMLQEISAAGNGVYVRASNSDVGLNNLLDAIEKLEKKEYESKLYGDFEDRFQWFIAPSLLLFLIEMLITERKSKLFSGINLFGDKK
jgi:Ca-activated chloride channel family protein